MRVAGISRANTNTGAAYVFAQPGPTITKPTVTDGNREITTKVSTASTVTVRVLKKNTHGHFAAHGVRRKTVQPGTVSIQLAAGNPLAKDHWEIVVSASNAYGTTPTKTVHLYVPARTRK